MKARHVSSLVAASSCLLLTPAHAAPSPQDVKVCVRIDEKSWSREGVRLPPGSPPPSPPPVAPKAEPAEPPSPPNAVTVPGKPKTLPPPNQARFSDGSLPPEVPAVAVELPEADGALAPSPAPQQLVPAREADPFNIDPKLYLKRLIEYQVTHEPRFESVEKGCSQTLVVELYPVKNGWTVFARYSGNAREEKVDVVQLDELDTFAERVTTALLRDRTIVETLTRTTVLRADSESDVRQIQTRPHLLLGMGSDLRLGRLPTALNATDPATDQLRLETPLSFAVGARNKFRAWALDATGRLDIGLVQRASRRNQGGGHVDYSVGFGFGLGFLAYANPDAVNTFYYGGGGSFEVSRYQTLGAKDANGDLPTPGGLWGGGLNIDAILGYEFMRTSTLHFFVQGTVSAPAYVFESENDQSRIRSYLPSGNAQVGVLF